MVLLLLIAAIPITKLPTAAYDSGLRHGLYDGSDLRNFGYSHTLGHGCDSTNPNYCFGYLTGYDRAFPHHTNSSEIWLEANSSGAMNGSGQSAPVPSKIVCTVSAFFCKAFMHGYILAYTQEIPYNQGRDAGQKYVDMSCI